MGMCGLTTAAIEVNGTSLKRVLVQKHKIEGIGARGGDGYEMSSREGKIPRKCHIEGLGKAVFSVTMPWPIVPRSPCVNSNY